MKKFVLLFVMLVLISTGVFAKEVVKLAIGEWPPYTSETDKNGKLAEVIVLEAFKLEGIEVQYEYYPWKRSYENTKKGDADGTFPWKKSEERDKDFIINKEVLLADEGVYFHLKTTKFDWNTLEDLKKYRVGVTVGYEDEGIYKAKGIKADVAPSEDLTFKKLLAGRIEVYQTSKIVGYTTINNLFSATEAKMFTNHPKVATSSEYFILFSKQTPSGQKFADKFDSGLKKLKKSGKYDEIIANFLGTK